MGYAAEGVAEVQEGPSVATKARDEAIQCACLPRPSVQGAVVFGENFNHFSLCLVVIVALHVLYDLLLINIVDKCCMLPWSSYKKIIYF